MFLTWPKRENKLLVAPPTLTYFLRPYDLLFTFSTSSLKPQVVLLSNYVKMFYKGWPLNVIQIRPGQFKMAAWRDFEDRSRRSLWVFSMGTRINSSKIFSSETTGQNWFILHRHVAQGTLIHNCSNGGATCHFGWKMANFVKNLKNSISQKVFVGFPWVIHQHVRHGL